MAHRPYNKSTGRNYKRDYEKFQGSPAQIKARDERNKARRVEGLKKGDPREVDHINPISRGGSNKKSNLEISSRSANRAKRNRFSGRIK